MSGKSQMIQILFPNHPSVIFWDIQTVIYLTNKEA